MVEVRSYVFCGLAVLLLFGSPLRAGQKPRLQPVRYAEGEILVKFKPRVAGSAFAMAHLHQMAGAKVIHHYGIVEGLQHIELGQADIREALSYYQNHPMVEYAEPNYIVSIFENEVAPAPLPDDERFGELWGLHNTGQADCKGQLGMVDADIDAPEAWEAAAGEAAAGNVIVAIVDRGMDYTHADLAANVWVNKAEIPGNGIDDDKNGFVDDIHGYDFYNQDGDPMDDHNHGTHVAGTIAAIGNNEIGVIGVAPQAKVMGIKFLGEGGSGEISEAILGMDYAIRMGAKVMNNSWGGGGFSQAMFDVIGRANEHQIVFVAAAGNSGVNNDQQEQYPSNYDQPNVIAVAATDNRDELASFSSYGSKKVHLAAPGDQILSAVRGNHYECYRGTSMATPHVSGVSALLLSVSPEMTPSEVRERLIRTSDEIPSLRRRLSARGRVNAYNAVLNIIPPKKIPDDLKWSQVARSISTPHFYPEDMDKTWTITHEGATYLKVHFSKFETETGYDIVKITDKEGREIDMVDGIMDPFWSFEAEGDTMNIHFKSDATVHKYGFDIDYYAFSVDRPK